MKLSKLNEDKAEAPDNKELVTIYAYARTENKDGVDWKLLDIYDYTKVVDRIDKDLKQAGFVKH